MSLVEYHDPDGLFPFLSSQLDARLPLRNLHWKSASRPARTIASLELEFISANSSDAPTPKTSHELTSNSDGRLSHAGTDRVRRHQIPGLRQTPFLKLYLLRCDDKETYKSSRRKLLRDWLKINVPDVRDSDGARHVERHESFEWLILHVVLPNTTAAAQPRLSKKHSGVDSDESREQSSSGTRWPGKGSRTMLEKLRSDFNQSNKLAFDRVAQIRLRKDAIPASLTQTISGTGTVPFPESAQERENSWSDLTFKLKTLVLSAFNERVTQYEEDIRERLSQRLLPGWNFCTFFALKEGLALSFEDVGLVEDALVNYDELSIGLDTLIREQESADSANRPLSLQPYTPELLHHLRYILGDSRLNDNGDDERSRSFDHPLSAEKKEYRYLIVSSNISLYDFRCYIFCKQFALLLRLAGIQSSMNKNKGSKADSSKADASREYQSAVPLAELSQRAAHFATAIARVMRDELWAAYNQLPSPTDDHVPETRVYNIIEFIVSSWTFLMLQQVIDESESPAAPSPRHMLGAERRRPPLRQRTFPARQSSLAARDPSDDSNVANDENELYIQQGAGKLLEPLRNTDAANFAAFRADLYVLQSRILEQLEELGISMNWSLSGVQERCKPASALKYSDAGRLSRFVTSSRLEAGWHSFIDLTALYELVKDHAAWFYSLGGRKLSAQKILYDLALLNTIANEHSRAVTYISMILPDYESPALNLVEVKILKLYAQCLKALGRLDECMRVILSILAHSAQLKTVALQGNRSVHESFSMSNQSSMHDAVVEDADEYVSDLFAIARRLPSVYSVPLDKYFDIMDVGDSIELYDDKDGFKMFVTIRQLLATDIKVDCIKIHLTEAVAAHNRELWLQSEGPTKFGTEVKEISVSSNITMSGEFLIDKLLIETGSLLFSKEIVLESNSRPTRFRRRKSATTHDAQLIKGPRIYCYPRTGSLQAEIINSPIVSLGQRPTLDILLITGSNNLQGATITLQPLTTAVILHVVNAEVIHGSAKVTKLHKPYTLSLDGASPGDRIMLRIPYETQHVMSEIPIQLDVQYETHRGLFSFIIVSTIRASLPFDVKFDYVFTAEAVFLKYWLLANADDPLHVLDAQLDAENTFIVQSPFVHLPPQLLFLREPMCLTYKLIPQTATDMCNVNPERQYLTLMVKHRSVAKDVLAQASSALSSQLEETSLAHRHLILHLFTTFLQRRFTSEDYVTAALTGEVELPAFTGKSWQILTASLPKVLRGDIQTWLDKWHESHSPLQILMPSDSTYTNLTEHEPHKFYIPNQIPSLSYLHTTSLDLATLQPLLSPSPAHHPVTTIGSPLPCKIRTRYTRRWNQVIPLQNNSDQSATLNVSADKDADADQDTTNTNKTTTPPTPTFALTLHASPTDWLISGPTRISFTAAENTETVFEISLVPLRLGCLALPKVEVVLVSSEEGRAERKDGGPAPEEEEVVAVVAQEQQQQRESCRTDYLSRGLSVVVVEDVRSTTVGLGRAMVDRDGADDNGEGDVLGPSISGRDEEEEEEKKETTAAPSAEETEAGAGRAVVLESLGGATTTTTT